MGPEILVLKLLDETFEIFKQFYNFILDTRNNLTKQIPSMKKAKLTSIIFCLFFSIIIL